MHSPTPPEDTFRVLLLGLILWALGTALGAAHGVFASLDGAVLAALSAFAAAYAVAVYALDPALRGAVDAVGVRTLAALALLLDAALAVVAWEVSRGTLDLAALAGFPLALVPLFVAPLALAADAAAAQALYAIRRGTVRSPGARRAAT